MRARERAATVANIGAPGPMGGRPSIRVGAGKRRKVQGRSDGEERGGVERAATAAAAGAIVCEDQMKVVVDGGWRMEGGENGDEVN